MPYVLVTLGISALLIGLIAYCVRQNQKAHALTKSTLAQARKQSLSKSAAANHSYAMRSNKHAQGSEAKGSGAVSDLEQANAEMSGSPFHVGKSMEMANRVEQANVEINSAELSGPFSIEQSKMEESDVDVSSPPSAFF
jgi:hypothetical protein